MTDSDKIAIWAIVAPSAITILLWVLERHRARKAEKENAKAIQAAKDEAASEASQLRAEITRISESINTAAMEARKAKADDETKGWLRDKLQELLTLANAVSAGNREPQKLEALQQHINTLRHSAADLAQQLDALQSMHDVVLKNKSIQFVPEWHTERKAVAKAKTAASEISVYLGKL